MSKYILVAMSNPVPGADEDYNAWYQDVHLPQVLSIDGMKSAQRYKINQEMTGGVNHKYVAIYDIDSEDVSQVMRRLGELHGTDEMIISPSLDESGAVAAVFEALGPPLRS